MYITVYYEFENDIQQCLTVRYKMVGLILTPLIPFGVLVVMPPIQQRLQKFIKQRPDEKACWY